MVVGGGEGAVCVHPVMYINRESACASTYRVLARKKLKRVGGFEIKA